MRAKPALAALAAAVALMAGAGAAQAQTYTVSNLTDSGASGDGSLRGEVRAANANPGPDSVVFAPGLSGRIVFEGEGIVISDPLDIEGPGPARLLVEQHAAHRVFEIEPSGGVVTIAGLHLAGGTAPSGGLHPHAGGDLLNDGADLTLADDVVSGGEAEDAGGIDSYQGALTLRSSTVTGNHAADEGGLSVGGPGVDWTIADSTIAGNLATTYVGGIGGKTYGTGIIEGSTIADNSAGAETGVSMLVETAGSLVIRNSTITGNRAVSEVGGGLLLSANPGASIRLEDSTVSGNYAHGGGGGLSYGGPSGGLLLLDTIVAGNTSDGADADIESWTAGPNAAFSLIGDLTGSKLTESVSGSDLVGVDPQLGPLADNGGPTQTMALAPTSPAVNRGGGALASDQRGLGRPDLYPGVPIATAPGANGADIGAYELQGTATVPPPPPTPAPAAGKAAPRVRVGCPKSAGAGGCRFALEVVSGKPKRVRGKLRHPRPESAVARAKVGAGDSALVTLVPKPKFAAKLEAAAKLLVREAETTRAGSQTRYLHLKAVA
jgi:hypothetical protein